MRFCLLLTVCLGLAIGFPANAQSDRAVALVVSVGENTALADTLQAQLQVIGAETLRSANPNNAELRAMLKRFANEAANARAAVIFLDAPAIVFEGREFVLPAEIYLDQPTDLFTQGIPILAFARAAAQAEEGGAVIMIVGSTPTALPGGLSPMVRAPDAVPGSAPILVAKHGSSDPVVQVMASVVRDEAIELGAVLRRMQAGEGISLSALPSNPVYLRKPAGEDPAATAATGVPADTGTEETVEELALLEKSLSRSAKRTLQRELRDLGYYKGLVDGIFGPQTRAAIIEFQTGRSEEATGFLNRRQLLDLRANR
ncbi:MAG: peptidoglycan-binding domain-containing protein [Pseudomonadota bacterium]